MNTLGNRIKEIRQKHSLTQQQFADRISVSRPFISRIESDKETPSDTLVKLIALEFNASYNWIVKGHGEMDPSTNIDVIDRTNNNSDHQSNLQNLQFLLDFFKSEQPSVVDPLLGDVLNGIKFILKQYGHDKNTSYFIWEAVGAIFGSLTDTLQSVQSLDKSDPAYLNKVFSRLREETNEVDRNLQSIGKLFEEQLK